MSRILTYILAFITSLGIFGASPSPAEISRIVVIPQKNSADIYWSGPQGASAVTYGFIEGNLINSASEKLPTYFHSLHIPDLPEGSLVYFHIVEEKNDNPKLTSTFRTLGTKKDESTKSLAVQTPSYYPTPTAPTPTPAPTPAPVAPPTPLSPYVPPVIPTPAPAAPSPTPVPNPVINASAGSGGSISPNGSVAVASGGSQAFTITPSSGYQIAGLTVDSINVGAIGSYVFTNVTANHTISATFSAAPVSPTPPATPPASPPPPAPPTPTPPPGPPPLPQANECNDSQDNDGDGLVDFADFGCFGPNGQETMNNYGWTLFTPSADTKIYYVSASGNDTNDGLSPEKPFKSILRADSAMRAGYPDWMLLKRGDVWDGTGTYTLNMDPSSGRSVTEPKLVGTYGTSNERPLLIDGRYRLFDGVSHVALVGVAFKQSANPVLLTGVASLLAAASDVLIEDCYLTGYNVNVQVDGIGSSGRASNWRIRGSVIADAMSQGVLLGGIDGLIIDGSVFDQNGWREGVPGFEATIFNHNMYLNNDNTGIVVRNTISARASSHGLQQRPGGITEDNLFLKNPISIFTTTDGRVSNNVVLDGNDIGTSNRGMGLWLGYLRNMEVKGNIVAHQVNGSDSRAMEFDDPSGALNIHDNIVYKWDGAHVASRALGLYFPSTPKPTAAVTIANNIFQSGPAEMVRFDKPYTSGTYSYSGNRYFSTSAAGEWFNDAGNYLSGPSAWTALTGETGAQFTAANFVDPERTIATYMASIGETPTLEAFMARARQQSKLNWHSEYTAPTVNSYIRAGFQQQVAVAPQPATEKSFFASILEAIGSWF